MFFSLSLSRLFSQEEVSDSTFTTYSQLSFTATRYENGINFRCEADNIVMQNELEKPLHNSLFLIVMCKLMCISFWFVSFRFLNQINKNKKQLNGIKRGNFFVRSYVLFGGFRSTDGSCIATKFYCNWTSRCLLGLSLWFKPVHIETSHLVSDVE